MRIRLRHLWETATTSYWFVPTLMLVASTLMASLLLHLDRNRPPIRWWLGAWLYSGGAEGAKTLLATVAGSAITVAGVAFSITIAALSQASSQFGPRLLRNFMRDTGNQVVLGTFVATFLYCVLILRSIHGPVDDQPAFVPHTSVTAGVGLAAASIAVLIYFVHHVSISLQAPAIIAAVSAELKRVVDELPQHQQGAAVPLDRHGTNGAEGDDDADDDGRAAPQLAAAPERAPRQVASTFDGYVQAVDYDELLALAQENHVVLRLHHRPGDHVIKGSPLLDVWHIGVNDDRLDRPLNATYIHGSRPTPEQDVEHAVRQLVEIAVRALSPGINDPFTAINCIDALGSGLCHIMRHGLPGPRRYDAQGALRLIVPVTTFAGLAGTAFNQLRQYGRSSVAVTVHLLEVIATCAAQPAATDAQRAVFLRHAEAVYTDAEQSTASPRDRSDLRARWEAASRACRHPTTGDGAALAAALPGARLT